jgi:hypothetical protein
MLKTPDNINSPENFFQTQIFSKDQPNVDESKKAELLKRNVSKEIDIFRKILCERYFSIFYFERYFSIFGFVQVKRRMNISIDLFKNRCF